MNAVVRKSAWITLSLLLVAGGAFAAAPDSLSAPVFSGTFIAEDGQTTRISVPQGGAVAIQHAQSGELYLLSGRLLAGGEVELKLDRYREPGRKVADSTERLVVEVGGAPATSLAGFGLQIQDVRWVARPAGSKSGVAEPPSAAEQCCVTCGGWRVCCTVSGGWCCEIESSCGSSCSAGPCETETEIE